MGFGVDGSIIGDLVDLLAFAAYLGDSIFLRVLQLLYNAVHNVDEDNLETHIEDNPNHRL